ncbi:uncharacterized protein M421DRAFT_102033 [Didymella exigua CBS 183.55]|uniref:Uncharacterized protein n=1 Tax=Didymella exigua CBS 183.55 TaxID=1150837 RepID=A0A6A5RIH9_9PLEO|nr:uncharacterized protein M421DRAFT_102033 [Didymella exigua CBS 183.55]KAF1926898.1 hypothetical protein M421DRAFT_102033 [Didymella exigua CBS 183.55]
MTIKPHSSDTGTEVCPQEVVAESNDERRRRWAHLLRYHHYEPVIFDVLSDELPKYTGSRAIDPTDVVTHMRECALILASAPRIFFAAVEGNLVSSVIKDADLQAECAVVQQRAQHQPSIYIHLLADEKGHAPSPEQYLMIRDMIQDYISERPFDQAHQVDNVTSPFVPLSTSTQGYRKYLSTPAANRSPKRIITLSRLITGITTRCSQISVQLHNTPLPYPPSEVGYALNAHKRLAQHRAHQSSNYVMNLVEDVCTYLYRSKVLAQHFKMHQHIIYLIFRPRQAAIAEIFCSGLLQCWVEGGGFNAFPAGRSVASSWKVASEEWEDHMKIAREVGLFEGKMRVLKERAVAWNKALDWKGDGEEMNAMDSVQDEHEMEGAAKA